ncbi:MAG: TIGR03915 family putative DNA repair protein [Synergistaceae bacterium]|nr:TIGR03915 family putative DNA repair protein [Synergistaceae bacterium]
MNASMTYVYDGTWDGLMCLVYRTAKDKNAPEAILRPSDAEPGFLFDTVTIKNDFEIAQATANALKKRISGRMLSDAWFALLSCDMTGGRAVDMALWRMLANVWERGKKTETDLADESAHVVRRAARRTGSEYNKYLGMVRFRDLGGIFYAELEPDCDVLTLLADHFSARLPGQGWILHDLRRKRAALYDMKEWIVTDMPPPAAGPIENIEKGDAYQDLWREFYRATTTAQRLNYKTQRGHMPKKYWKHLTENPGEFHGNM